MIPAEDLKFETYDPRPPGGQRVGVSHGVKITHLPTGTVAVCMTARSQFRNKAIAMDMILAALTHPDFDS